MRILLAILMAVAAVSCGGGGSSPAPSPSPGAANGIPQIGAITIAPSFGIAQLTSFAMQVQASDPNGDPLTYTWEFGDGTTGTKPSTTKTYDNGGPMTVRITVKDGNGGSASDTRALTVGGMTGQWTVDVPRFGKYRMDLKQSGRSINGSLVFLTDFGAAKKGDTGTVDPAEPGTIDASGNVEIRFKVGPFIDTTMRGKMADTGQTITGGLFASGFNGEPFTATKQ